MKKTFDRRQFLKASLITAGSISTVSLVGGGDSSSSSSSAPGSAGGKTDPAARYFPQSVASGDPRQASIILWTRIENLEAYSVDLQVASDSSFSETSIIVAADVTASLSTANDNCLKLKVTGLTEGTTYYYRFVIRDEETLIQPSRTGRFKTAGATTNESPVRFAALSCQDYIGRYYNTLFSLLGKAADDLDFVLHLGDYIYETTGDPSFQNTQGRTVTFTHPEEALSIGEGNSTFLAANSISNYRDLYKTYRSDELLQRVHEKFAFVNIWDDHEFSDDSWQDNGTYQGVETGEESASRKLAAAQAFFEYQPIDLDGAGAELSGGADLGGMEDYSATNSVTANSPVNRTLRFGKHVCLSLADYRTYRPDHLIPEDAFPGLVVMDQAALSQTLVALGKAPGTATAEAAVKLSFFKVIQSNPASNTVDLYPVRPSAYTGGNPALPIATLTAVDMTTPSNSGALTLALAGGYTQAYIASGMDPVAAQNQGFIKAATLLGSEVKLDIVSVNATLESAAQAQEQGGDSSTAAQLRAIKVVDDNDTLEHGLSYAQMGKQSLAGSSLGSRYLVVRDSYDLYCAYLSLLANNTDYDNAWGDTQTEALLTGMGINADATWQVLGSSVSFTSLLLNGTLLANAVDQLQAGASAVIPPELKNNTFYLNVDHWDGFPIRRKVLMGDLPSPLPTTLKGMNTVILSGDIHASFATDHGVDGEGNRAVEFTVAAVSSASFNDLLGNQAGALLGDNPAAGSLVSALPAIIDPLLQGANQLELSQATSPEEAATLQNMKLSRAILNGTAIFTADRDQFSVSYQHYYSLSNAQDLSHLNSFPPMEVNNFTVAKVNGKNGPLTEA